MSKSFTVEQLVNMLVGHIDSIGETRYDETSLKNIETAEVVIDNLLETLMDNAKFTGVEFSRVQLKDKSLKLLKYWHEMLGDTFEYIEAKNESLNGCQ